MGHPEILFFGYVHVNTDERVEDSVDGLRGNMREFVVHECYRRAAQAKRLAQATNDTEEKRDLLAVEQKWLALARSQELQHADENQLGWSKR